MTVDPRLQLTPGEYLIHPDGSASKVVDRRNMTVDEILATGQYTDKRGRAWNYDPDFDVWVEYSSPEDGILHLGWIVDTKDVRLLIERDQHRGECPGLHDCGDHPVHHAVFYRWERAFRVYEPDPNSVETIRCGTLPEAMEAARAWAVGG